MSKQMPISGFSPEPGTPERIADGLDAVASHLHQAAEKLRVLAAEVREVGESLKNWIEVAMRAGEKAAGEIDWSTTFHPPPATPGEMSRLLAKLDSEQLQRRLAELAAEQQAVRTLLRAVVRRERERARMAPEKAKKRRTQATTDH